MKNPTPKDSDQEPLGILLPKRLTGQEAFHLDGSPLAETVCSFWSWAYSTLAANNLRGHLAEFLVASALGVTTKKIRVEWDDYDIELNNLKIEVKSAAYLQAWKQESLSAISFKIAPSFSLDEFQKLRQNEPERKSDIYVFCLLTTQNKQELDPTNLADWVFYVLPTSILNKKLPQQKTITLNALKALNPTECSFNQLAEVIRHTSKLT